MTGRYWKELFGQISGQLQNSATTELHVTGPDEASPEYALPTMPFIQYGKMQKMISEIQRLI